MWKLLLLGLMLCVCINDATGEHTRTDDEEHQALLQLLQDAEVRHAAYQESLRKLDAHLSPLGDDKRHLLLRKKRQVLGRLEDSLVAFCQTLMDVPSPGNSSTTTSPSPPQTSAEPEVSEEDSHNWLFPSVEIKLIDVRVEKQDGVSIVEMKVNHSVNGFVTRSLTNRVDMGRVQKRQKLKIRRGEKAPKISTVSFAINTSWCKDFPDNEPPAVSFRFSRYRKSGRQPSSSVQVQVCKKSPEVIEAEQSLGPQDKAELPPQAKFRYNLTNEDLKTKQGENITLIAEVDLRGKQSTDLYFFIRSFSFNHETEILASSMAFVRSISRHSRDETFLIEEMNNPEEEISTFTSIEELPSPPGEASKAANPESQTRTDESGETSFGPGGEEKAREKAYLQLTFNTASGSETGLVSVYQGLSYDNAGDISSTGVNLPLYITRPGEDFPIPEDMVSFFGTKSSHLCNSNKKAKSYGEQVGVCHVKCLAFGRNIKTVEFVKEGGLSPKGKQVKESFDEYKSSSLLRLDIDKPETSGNYLCRVKTRTGKIFTKTIEVIIGSLPFIDRSQTRFAYVDTDNGTVVEFSCSASGTDVELSLYKIDYLPESYESVETRVDENYLKTDVIEEEDRKSFKVSIPDDLATSETFYCNAKNKYGSDVEYIYPFIPYNATSEAQYSA